MKHTASIFLTILSTLMLGFYALAWLLRQAVTSGSPPLLVHAIGVAGLAFAVLAFREWRRQRNETVRLKQENEGFV